MNERKKIRATYRLQFTKGFPFENAEAIVPYLHRLGVSHIYSSPIFAARPGSLSGYDTCDFSRINPELGGESALESLVNTLHVHDMGLIVDFVPNHMSTHPQWNKWWRNVLANGPSSAVSEYFDIDWYPVNSNVHGKVLLPILGQQYGNALEAGELHIEYRDEEFCLYYADLNLPLNPRQMKFLLRHGWAEVTGELDIEPAVRQEFESILFQLDHTPGYRESGTEARMDRERETQAAMLRLTRVISESPALRRHLESVIRRFNGSPGDPESFDLLHTLLQQQPYRLSYWRTAMHEINYRRFFDINDLIGLRIEHGPLFTAAHAKLIELVERGWIDGVRLDHIDGLLDPQQYLLQFREATRAVSPDLYLVVEKILARQEWLNEQWPVDGSTGYNFLALVNGLWVREKNLREIEVIYQEFCGVVQPEQDAVYRAKRLIIVTSMSSELKVLAQELNRLSEQNRRSRDFTLDGLQEALREVVACFPVYRTYISERGFSASDEMAINEAIGQAKRRNPTFESSIFEFIRWHICPVRQPGEAGDAFAQRLSFAMKFQQYTSPVQAKGMEDTVFYRYSPLASLNEVGSGAGRRTTTPEEFHDVNLYRMQRWPDAMLTTSTHDTKRGEDARIRISTLAESPQKWKSNLLQWSKINQSAKTSVNGRPAPDPADEYLYYQNLLGMWPPASKAADDEIVDRMKAFMNKALKEAKVHTSWINPSNDYDTAMENFVEQTLRGACSAEFIAAFLPIAERTAMLGVWESISQMAIKLASPGVADTYQGDELWNLSLVDPDNRRPVDYSIRQHRLTELLARLDDQKMDIPQRRKLIAELCRNWGTGELKLLYMALALRLRAREPQLFALGKYVPLNAEGPHAEHLIAFARVHEDKVFITVAARWFGELLHTPNALQDLQVQFQKTWIQLPNEGAAISGKGPKFKHVVTGAIVPIESATGKPRFRVSDALDALPAGWVMMESEK
jgi:(1->4)-alpha-D-glucan 1-alpha-D-glucosylmutase